MRYMGGDFNGFPLDIRQAIELMLAKAGVQPYPETLKKIAEAIRDAELYEEKIITGHEFQWGGSGDIECSVCKGCQLNNGMPTHCPKREITAQEIYEVESGYKDFIDGEWVVVQ